jgi:hypothetical protein
LLWGVVLVLARLLLLVVVQRLLPLVYNPVALAPLLLPLHMKLMLIVSAKALGIAARPTDPTARDRTII